MSADAPRGAAKVEKFSSVRRNSLRGFATVTFPSGITFADVAIHVDAAGRAWAAPPGKPMFDANGAATRDAAGKIRYVPIITFASKELRDRFSAAVVAAVNAAHPEALQPGGE